jgi:hypothetical protein
MRIQGILSAGLKPPFGAKHMSMETTKPSIEDLLKPRYIIENEWVDCPYPNGTILVPIKHSNGFGPEEWEPGMYAFTIEDLDKYPYLTRKLSWWEERKPEEMPEFVKYAENGMVAKVDRFDMETTSAWFMYLEGGIHPYCPGGSALENTHWLPATESEYSEYITSQP